MIKLLTFLLCFLAFSGFAQQSTQIVLRENVFNNYKFSQGGERIDQNRVKESMAAYPETLKKFVTGQRNVKAGSVMRIATTVLLTSGLVYFIADDYSARSGRFLLASGVTGTILGFIGPGIREEGKRNVSDAVQEYNYQILQRQQLPISQKSFETGNPYAFRWKFNF
jgi:hypothetical protein